MRIKELTNQEFKNFSSNFYLKSIYQTPEYAFTMNNQDYDSMFIGLEKDGTIVAASLILIKKESGFKYAYAPKGFLIKYEDFYLFKEFSSGIKEFLNKKGIIAIKINPILIRNIYNFNNQTVDRNEAYSEIFESIQHNGYYHLGYNNFFEALKPRFEAIIDLSQTIETLHKNVKKEYRTKIRSANKNGIEICRGTDKELEILYNFTKEKYPRNLNYFKDIYGFFSNNNKIDYFYTKLNTETYLKNIQKKLSEYESKSSEISYKLMRNKTNKTLINKKINTDKDLNKYRKELIEATKLLRENPEGIITSGILIVKQSDTVTILIDGHYKNYQRFNSKHFLVWNLISFYKKQGFKSFNLGGVSNIMTDSSKYYGLNNFKINFGAKMYEYAGDFELIINKRSYNLYRNYVPLKNLIKSKLSK